MKNHTRKRTNINAGYIRRPSTRTQHPQPNSKTLPRRQLVTQVRPLTKNVMKPSQVSQVHPKRIINKKRNTEKLQFVHIPKTGGSTISESGYEQFGIQWGNRDPRLKGLRLKRKLPISGWHMPPNILHTYAPNVYIKPRFCVVRDPYSRIISEYEYEKEIGLIKAKKRTRRHQVVAVPLYLQNVNNFVKEVFEKYKKNKYIFDGHIIPQYEYAAGCQYILKFENLETEFNNLMSQFDISLKLGDLRRKKQRCASKSKPQLNDKSIELINRFYQQDFIQFQYSMK